MDLYTLLTRSTLALLATAWLAIGPTSSPLRAAPPNPASAFDFSELTATIQSWIDKGYYPSAVIIVARDNKILYQKSFGNADPQTEFRIASMTKWLEAATIMTLVDDGKISLDDPIAKYLPEFKDARGKATIRQCLSHTAGLNDLKLKPDEEILNIADCVHQMALAPITTEPGKKFDYGDRDMTLTGRIAEVVTGQPWEILFADRIAKPCDMPKTMTGMNMWYVGRRIGGDRFPNSCPEDYLHFLQMLANRGMYNGKRVLSEKAIDEMQADQVKDAAVKHDDWIQLIKTAKHNGVYGLGEWREAVDEKNQSLRVSGPSYQGGYPWIDKQHNVYGVFMGINQKFDGYHNSPTLSTLVGKAIEAADKAVK